MRLKDRIAIVTGGARGIGRGVAIAFAREGAHVLVNYLNRSNAAEEVVAEIEKLGRKALAVKADVASTVDAQNMVKMAIEKLGGLDILVNNAGLSQPAMLLNMTEAQWDRVINVHLKGTFNCTQAAARYMKEKNYGKIINVISGAGIFGTIGQVNYSAAKGGIIAFTKSAARELGPYKINVNAIGPGLTATEMTEKVRTDPKLREIYTKRIFLGRFVEPEELAATFVFLASSESDYITSQVLSVDGGYSGG